MATPPDQVLQRLTVTRSSRHFEDRGKRFEKDQEYWT
jgi:hypothetical protein